MSSKLVVLDTFSGVAAGTAITSHTPEFGGPVTCNFNPPVTTAQGRLRGNGLSGSTYAANPPSGVYTVEADVYVASLAHGVSLNVSGVVVGYFVTAGVFNMNGTGVVSTNGNSYNFIAGRTYTWRVDVAAAMISAYVNGTLVESVVPTIAPSAGPVGINFSAAIDTDATGFQVSRFVTWYTPAMGVFEAICNSDADPFLDPDTGLGEPVVYVQNGIQLSVNAMVKRTPPERFPGLNQVSGNIIDVWIANDATLGVTSVQVGTDQMILSGNFGGTPKVYTVNRIVNQDAGIWHLQLV